MTTLATSLPPARNAPQEWAAFREFLARPSLPQRTAPFAAGLRGVLRLYLLDAVLMLTLAVIASTILLTGVEIPDNTLNEMALTPSWIAVIVIGAPLTEELMFRSWLSGRPGHLIAGLLIGASIVALPALTAATPGNDVYVSAALGAVLAICVFSLWRWRRSPPFKWFSRLFPVIFWLVALSFALIHLINYEAASLLVLLPLVIPQLIAGTLFGYARVQYGLWASIMLHALHNGSAVVAMLIAQANAPAGAG